MKQKDSKKIIGKSIAEFVKVILIIVLCVVVFFGLLMLVFLPIAHFYRFLNILVNLAFVGLFVWIIVYIITSIIKSKRYKKAHNDDHYLW